MAIAKSTRNSFLIAGAGVLFGCVAIGISIGQFIQYRQNPEPVPTWAQRLPQVLHAESASRGKAISLATGQLETGVDGIFVLDHLTGNLFCWVINPKTGGVGAEYMANVRNDLGMTAAHKRDFYRNVIGWDSQDL